MNKMAEKNDQKMRERAERAEKFQAKLQELLALASEFSAPPSVNVQIPTPGLFSF